ncbi:MAG: hypothetical protein MI921_01335 [Cytophagales bacterium]|nr:hypothetical protein [Cytophagales bacterium]
MSVGSQKYLHYVLRTKLFEIGSFGGSQNFMFFQYLTSRVKAAQHYRFNDESVDQCFVFAILYGMPSTVIMLFV